ncbi:MAG: DUF4097 family beta strand repeat protein [Clostridia bacterium]|nr:DUF4097 family beta strand repeat protein [Clostridia bacterium]
MTTAQKVIKYLAIAFAMLLIASVFSGIVSGVASVVGFLTGYPNEDSVDITEHDLSDESISRLDIDVAATNLTIQPGETLKVYVTGNRVSVRVSGETLRIEEKSTFFHSTTSCTVNVTLPVSELERADISTGAGTLHIEGLSAKVLDLDLGAGDTVLKNINISDQADIDGGAGKLDIDASEISELDLDMGVGSVNISAALLGESEIDCGVGQLKLELTGEKSDYSIDIDKGIGDVKVDGESVRDGAEIGNGHREVNISSGVGDVEVKFNPPDKTEAIE